MSACKCKLCRVEAACRRADTARSDATVEAVKAATGAGLCREHADLIAVAQTMRGRPPRKTRAKR